MKLHTQYRTISEARQIIGLGSDAEPMTKDVAVQEVPATKDVAVQERPTLKDVAVQGHTTKDCASGEPLKIDVAVQKGPETEDVAVQTRTEKCSSVNRTTQISVESCSVGSQTYSTDVDDDTLTQEFSHLLEILLQRKGVRSCDRKGCGAFIEDTVNTVHKLSSANAYNSLFGIAKVIGKKGQEVLHLDRMPYQMIEYQIKFANGGHQSFVSIHNQN